MQNSLIKSEISKIKIEIPAYVESKSKTFVLVEIVAAGDVGGHPFAPTSAEVVEGRRRVVVKRSAAERGPERSGGRVPVESWRRAGPGPDGRSVARCRVDGRTLIVDRGQLAGFCLCLSPIWGSRLSLLVACPSLRGLAAVAVGRLAFLKTAIG